MATYLSLAYNKMLITNITVNYKTDFFNETNTLLKDTVTYALNVHIFK